MRPGLCQVSKSVPAVRGSRRLHPSPNYPRVDAPARPDDGSDVSLDAAAEHNGLLRDHPVAGKRLPQASSCRGRAEGPVRQAVKKR